MSSDFDSFDESPNGGFIESPHGARGFAHPVLYMGITGGSLMGAFTIGTAYSTLKSNMLPATSYGKSSLVLVSGATVRAVNDGYHVKSANRFDSYTRITWGYSGYGNLAFAAPTGDFAATGKKYSYWASIAHTLDGDSAAEAYTSTDKRLLSGCARANGQIVFLYVGYDGGDQYKPRTIGVLSASNAAPTWTAVDAYDGGYPSPFFAGGYLLGCAVELDGVVWLYVIDLSGSTSKVLSSSDLSSWTDQGAWSGIAVDGSGYKTVPNAIIKTQAGSYLCTAQSIVGWPSWTNRKIYRSTDLLTWTAVYTGTELIGTIYEALDGTLWASRSGAALLQSTDDGQNWASFGTAGTGGYIGSILEIP